AFDTLESVVRHHLDPVASLKSYDGSESTLPDDDTLNGHDMAVMEAPTAVQRIAQANQLDPTTLSDVEMRRLLDFLHSLTDRSHLDMRRLVPKRVLSEISVFD
ncbi:MAG: cytochrome-c peroxidase, partial [Verrucomicrobiaceae bacterium]|nr:cytochrome-c peroxidase [Verrucomicrobiaceae bacterium]